MTEITGRETRIWGNSLVGFGQSPHRTGKSCLYPKNLDAVDREVLQEIIRDSVDCMRERYDCA